jgi:hypothetical protein
VGQEDLLGDADAEVRAIVRRVRDARSRPPAAESVVAVQTDRVRTEQHREAGPVHVGYQFWRRLGLDAILSASGLSARACRLA